MSQVNLILNKCLDASISQVLDGNRITTCLASALSEIEQDFSQFCLINPPNQILTETVNAIAGSKDVLDRATGPEEYHAVHEQYHPTKLGTDRHYRTTFQLEMHGLWPIWPTPGIEPFFTTETIMTFFSLTLTAISSIPSTRHRDNVGEWPFKSSMVYDAFCYVHLKRSLGNLNRSTSITMQELDYATNFLADGPGEWKDSGLGEAFRAAVANPDGINIIDWKPYGPSILLGNIHAQFQLKRSRCFFIQSHEMDNAWKVSVTLYGVIKLPCLDT